MVAVVKVAWHNNGFYVCCYDVGAPTKIKATMGEGVINGWCGNIILLVKKSINGVSWGKVSRERWCRWE